MFKFKKYAWYSHPESSCCFVAEVGMGADEQCDEMGPAKTGDRAEALRLGAPPDYSISEGFPFDRTTKTKTTMAKYNYSDAKQRAAEHERDFDSFSLKLPKDAKLFKVKKAGIVRLDIIPFVAGKGNPFADEGCLHYERTYYVHSRIGPNEVSVVCPKDTADTTGKTGPCPVCELQRKLKLDPDADEKLVKSLWPKERQLFQVIDLDNPSEGIQLWDVSYHLFGKLLDARIRDADPDDNYHRFYHLSKGLSIKVGFVEESFGKHKFYKAETIDFKERREQYDESIIDKGWCLDELIKILSYDEIKAALDGEGGGSKKDDRDDDRKPSRRDDDEKPRSRRDDDDDDRKPSKKDDDDDRKPSRKSDDDDDRPSRRRDDDDDRKPSRSNRDEDDEKPKRRDDDDDDRKPAKKDEPKKGGWRDEDDDEPKKEERKPAKKDDDDDDRPARRRDDDDEKPAKRRDDDDERKPSRRDDDDEKPAKKDEGKPSRKKDDDWD
jgi:hypothetical protein